MSTESRKPYSQTVGARIDGIQTARVIGHADPTLGGALQVTLYRQQGNKQGEVPYVVRPAFPFFGNTAYEHQGNNLEDFDDTQKSYGMWFVPPDAGTDVLVVFVNGDPAEGYWLGCIPPRFAHRMVPAIGASTEFELSEEDNRKFNTIQALPVGEINRRLNGQTERVTDESKIKKPLHPIAHKFLEQGLIEDLTRGTTVTTSRRVPPNSVYGISTPGPFDRRSNAKRAVRGDTLNRTAAPVPVSRLGGTQFVMDDGDDRFQRRGPASEVAVGNGYADTQNDERGDPTIPADEYTRLRTRTGHQLLFHNSEDLIYIGNARGTSWIELTSDGKIDVYAADSVSVHSQNDVNLYADRDINMEAGRNVNIKASAEYSKSNSEDSKGRIKDSNDLESGRIQIESAYNTNILIGANGKIETRKYTNENDVEVDGSMNINIKGDKSIAVGTGNVNESYKFQLHTGGNNLFTATNSTDILSIQGNHTETAPRIDMNGPPAANAGIAQTISDLKTHPNNVTSGDLSYATTKFQETFTLNSIMKRIPMHEPWVLHENIAPAFLKPGSTDREV